MIIESQQYKNLSKHSVILEKAEYENCHFEECDLSDQDFKDFKFIDCVFKDCNLSLVNLTNTSIQNTRFINCKMLGLRFDYCNNFNLSFSFDKCTLHHSSFYAKKLKKIVFENSVLHEVDFTDADISESKILNCDLLNANFENTNLEKVDFRESINIQLDPDINKIKNAIFNIETLPGLLTKYNIKIK